MMVNFKLSEEMRNDVINMSWPQDKKKIWVTERNWTYDLHQSDALTTELRRTRGKLVMYDMHPAYC